MHTWWTGHHLHKVIGTLSPFHLLNQVLDISESVGSCKSQHGLTTHLSGRRGLEVALGISSGSTDSIPMHMHACAHLHTHTFLHHHKLQQTIIERSKVWVIEEDYLKNSIYIYMYWHLQSKSALARKHNVSANMTIPSFRQWWLHTSESCTPSHVKVFSLNFSDWLHGIRTTANQAYIWQNNTPLPN